MKMKKQEIEKAIACINNLRVSDFKCEPSGRYVKEGIAPIIIKVLQNELENDSEKTDELIGDMGFRLADLRDENKLLKEKLKQFETSENKPLSLEELKGMVGKEIYFVDTYDNHNQPKWSGYIILESIENTEICVSLNNFWNEVTKIYYDLVRNENEIFFYKHKPKENDNEW